VCKSGIGSLVGTSRSDAILAVLVGCDLRRAEVVTLRIEDVQLRADHWVTADLIGKVGDQYPQARLLADLIGLRNIFR
jgi:hypothetical protein